MNEADFLELAAEIFGISPTDLKLETPQEEISQWDSFAHLNLLMKCSETFGVDLDPDKITELLSLSEIYQYFKRD